MGDGNKENSKNVVVNTTKGMAKKMVKKAATTAIIHVVALIAPFALPILAILVVLIVVIALFSSAGNDLGTVTLNNGECGFTLTSTSLSKSEYKDKVTEYARSHSGMQPFADNAASIYELATKMHLNPELVVVRAVLESGSGTHLSGANNYWGLAAYNTGSGGSSYSSFEEGYTAYLNNISQYATLSEMMSKYAYIGDYWYNPGGSGIGGCYYASYIYGDNMPTRVKNACASTANACGSYGGSVCTPTTAEDQEAYANWQIETMNSHRKAIFGITDEDDAKSCINYSSSLGSDTFEPNWNNKNAWYKIVDGGQNPFSYVGQCTWFAWGKMYEIYGYPFKFTGNGRDNVGSLLQNHGDIFQYSTTPATGALYSVGGQFVYPYGHVGVILNYDSTTSMITYFDGNYDGINNTYEGAKTDWQINTRSLASFQGIYGNNPITYAVPIGGVDAARKKLQGG